MDSAVYDELARLETAAGIDVNCTISADYISGTTKVQMGDSVTVNLEYPTNFGVGGVLSVPITMQSTVTGRSELYWK